MRAALSEVAGVTEKNMFGTRTFLLDGHIILSALKDGGVLLRATREELADVVDDDAISPMMMGSEEMVGWLQVASGAVADDEVFGALLDIGIASARDTATKPARKRRNYSNTDETHE